MTLPKPGRNRGVDVFLEVGADVSQALGAMRQVRQEAVQTARRLDQASGGNISRAGRIGGAFGRVGGGVTGVVGAGAGLQAGIAVFEQLIEQLIELFEGTEIFTQFQEALKSAFEALAPFVGVLIQGLTPAVKALQPLLEQLAISLSPVIEQLTLGLTDLIAALVPVLIPAVQILGVALTALASIVRVLAQAISAVIGIIPGRDTVGGAGGTAYQTATRQLEQARQERLAAETPNSRSRQEMKTIVIVDGQVIEDTASRTRRLNADYGIGVIN